MWWISLPDNSVLASEGACGKMQGAQVHVSKGDREGWCQGAHIYVANFYCARQWEVSRAQSRWVPLSGGHSPVGKTKINYYNAIRWRCDGNTKKKRISWPTEARITGRDNTWAGLEGWVQASRWQGERERRGIPSKREIEYKGMEGRRKIWSGNMNG